MEEMNMNKLSEKVVKRLEVVVVGSLRYCSDELREDGDIALADELDVIADHIIDGIATDEEWFEALDQLNMAD